MELETCSLSSTDIERLRSYGVPDDAKVLKPSSNQTIFDRPQRMVAVYMEFFDKCGLRFPLTPFFCRCLLYYELSITQLAPDFVRCIVGFEVLCRVAKIEPCMALFTYFFYPNPIKNHPNWHGIRMRTPNPTKWILNFPECSVWKAKFVFIEKEMFPEEMSWNRKTYNRYPEPYLKANMLDEMRILSGFSVEWSVLLSEEMLHSAKMPNVYSGPLPVKFRAKNGKEISAVDFLREMSTGGKDGKSRKIVGAGATPFKRAKLSAILMRDDDDDNDDGVQVAKCPPIENIHNKRIAAVDAALEEVRCTFKDSERELFEAHDAARKYQQRLSAEVEKNRVLQEALDKAETELETARKEDKNLAENYRQALKKNVVLEEDLDKATRQLERASKQVLEKISALEEAKNEAEASRTEASNYEQALDAEMKKNVALKEAVEKAKSELDAEKTRSAIAREEADKAKKDADDLHSRIHAALKIRT